MAIDPVCGMEVDKRKTSLKTVLDGRHIYFCCANCKTQFDADPSKFVFAFS
ncbi:MAG TPA: YHS domain-containing protein [Candidatus Nitrosotalea sp.]|nr:YHS domain-containing protein [Candidatus Nitrosotalea sp.]